MKRMTTENGATILIDHQPWLSTCALNFTFRIGSRHEPAGLEGATHFIEHLLFKGTSKRNVDEIAREINRQGGSFNAVTSTDYMRLDTRIIPEDFADGLGLMKELVTDSVFPDHEFDRERGVIHEEIAEYNDSPEDKCFDEWLAALWAEQRLGRPVLGTGESLEGMTRESLIDWYRTLLHPTQCVLSLAGKLTEEMEAMACGFFEKWPSLDLKSDPAAKAVGTPGFEHIPRDLEQAQFCLGVEAPSRNHPDRFAFQLGDIILGGGMGSRLFTEIREKRGLAYTISSSWFGMEEEGYFLAYGSSTSDTIADVLELTREEIRKLTVDGPTKQELDTAKAQFRRLILMSRDSPVVAAGRNADRELYGDPHLSEDELMRNFLSPDVEDIQRVCANFLKQSPTITLVGKCPDHLLERYRNTIPQPSAIR